MMGMKNPNPKRNSIIHIQNVILSELNNIVPNRETQRYVIAYEQKSYRVHYLLYKVDKELVKDKISERRVDINIREDYRFKIKSTDTERVLMKNVVVRIVPTRYPSLDPIYAKFITFKWRHTGKGAVDTIEFTVPECPMITNSSNLKGICYKKIANQLSWGGTHGTHTYLIASTIAGEHKIGNQVIISNTGKTYMEIPVTIML